MGPDILPLLRAGIAAGDLHPSTVLFTRAKIHSLKAEIKSRDEEITKLDSLFHLDSLLHGLKLQRVQAKENLDRHESIFSPIRRLPSDVLLSIFCLAAHQAKIRLSEPPCILRSVCYWWRNLTLSSPSLWSGLEIHISSKNSETAKVYTPQDEHLVCTALSLSKNCPLDLTLRVEDIEPPEEALITKYVAPTSTRWKSLRLRILESNIQSLSSIAGCLRTLESLDIILPPPWVEMRTKETDEALSQLFRSAPLLRKAKIFSHYFHELALPLRQLTSLHVGVMDLPKSGDASTRRGVVIEVR
ncbi:uncharacterized protein EV420DRAFT_1311091 [Desarmillaria tabescens]|uniref:F-box domain-containing protein n=1 Tax=Armillaria tabescens TaxID=1929756 RepID=A0AA39N1N0_ARMTA|nr:uncharacterized protein EV420DRAFT_1311091 [Desarmillaria tabescens]KAK0454203.1 hypothetical protein EV420DRAFT_1311091 [Desarmillaria tabescens]